MSRRPYPARSAVLSVLLGIGFFVVATGLRLLLDHYLDDRVPWITYFLAVAITAWVADWRGGVVCMVLSVLAGNYMFLPPLGYPLPVSFDQAMQDVLFLVVGAVIVSLNEQRLAQQKRARGLLNEARVDIEQRIAAEKAMIESEANFRAVAETSSTAIYIHDGEKLVYVNPTAEKITGYTREELYMLDMWDLVHPDNREVVRQRAIARFKGEASPDRYEYRLVHRDGTTVWVDFGATVIEYNGKRCILANAFDVTQRKTAEQALIRSEKLASAGRLAATIAHEINNPLEAITNLLYLARTDTPNAAKYIDVAEDELRRVAHIARQTLGFYRDSGLPERVKVTSLVNDVIGLYAKRIESKGILVRLKLDEGVELMGSSGEVRQVISNLLSNSIDALPSGGIIDIRLRRAVQRRSGMQGVRLIVADNGPGIPYELRGRIFEAFFTTKQDVGTGLGLWVTRSLVEKHGGSIAVRSDIRPERHGTVFSIFFPAAAGSREFAA